MYLRYPNFIQKRVSKNALSLAVDITFFSANISDFKGISLLEIQTFKSSYFYEKLSYTNIL